MKIAYIGLGKMGFAMVERLLEKGHTVVANNRSRESIDKIAEKGAIPAYTIDEMISQFGAERKIVWMMVPWQSVDQVLSEVLPKLSAGDILIDGGNSPYFETVKRAKFITDKDVKFLDIGTSGGPGGARNGACLMIGGDKSAYLELEDLFRDLALPNGYGFMGDYGAGHFVKMVHNGIEYGMMQAIGEGFEVMKKAPFNLDLQAVTDIYSHGSVIESRLVSWLGSAYKKHGVDLADISGEVAHSGEGEWTVRAADELGVPVEVIKNSLEFRKKSIGNPTYTGQVVSALRNEFGGHDVSKKYFAL